MASPSLSPAAAGPFRALVRVVPAAAVAAGILLALAGPASADLQSCRRLSEKGVHASAIRACGAVIDGAGVREASRASALFYRANSRYSTRDVEGALADVDAALALAPDYGPSHALRAAIRLEIGQTEAALADLDRAIALGFDGIDVRNRRATARLATGDLEGAVADLGEVVAAAPRDAIARLRLAVVLNELGRNGPALEAADAAIAINPRNADAYGVRAKIRSESGDVDGALEDFARPESGAEGGARYLVGKADLLARSGRRAEALAAVDEALAARPDDTTAAILKADILEADGRPAAARDALDGPALGDAGLSLRRARLALAAGDSAAAEADYGAAIALDAGLAAAHFERAQLRDRRGDHAAAIAGYDRALAADPGLAARQLHYLRGKAKYRSGDLDGAVADFTADLDAGETADARLWRALALADLGEFSAAIEDANRLVAMAPNEARAEAVLGDVLLKAGRLADGREAHERALALDPAFAPSRQRLEELGPRG